MTVMIRATPDDASKKVLAFKKVFRYTECMKLKTLLLCLTLCALPTAARAQVRTIEVTRPVITATVPLPRAPTTFPRQIEIVVHEEPKTQVHWPAIIGAALWVGGVIALGVLTNY